MITVPETTEELIKHSPFLEEALSKDLINLSSLARELKPQIDKRLYKDVSSSSIMMALRRLTSKLKKKAQYSENMLKIADVTLRSNISEFTFSNSPTLLTNQQKLLEEVEKEKNSIVTLTHGVYETTIFVSSSLQKKMEQLFKIEHLRSEFKNLSSITLILPKESVYVPGIYYNILKLLAWEGINFVEVISSFTELTIYLVSNEVDKAFSVLKTLTD